MSKRKRQPATAAQTKWPAHGHPVKGVRAWLAIFLSLIVPGSGQAAWGYLTRGLVLFISVVTLGALIAWDGAVALAAPLAGVWLWGVWDAYRLTRGRRASLLAPVVLGLVIVYGIGVSAARVDLGRLVSGWPAMRPYLRAMLHPEMLAYRTEDLAGSVPFQVPCISPLPEPSREGSKEPRLTTNLPCAEIGDTIEVSGEGFFPDFEGEMWWQNPIGDRQRVIADGQQVKFVTDGQGRFRITIKVPLAVPLTSMPAPGETQTHTILAQQQRPYGRPQPTQTLSLVLQKIGETVALAFLATVLGMVLAVPVSFLAARNLMGGSPVTLAIYYLVRTILNIIRSIETLIWAIIFAVWVGLGPFDGMLALLLHTIAALAKLYSEAIESIDPGPIEAIRASGATGPQVVAYAVLPQILPTFASFTLYRWDINVRMSTVIGLVSDAGLGFLVIQWIRLNNFSAMATAIIAIVLVIAILDYVSAWVREKIIAGAPPSRSGRRRRNSAIRYATIGLLTAGFVAAFAWSWRVAQVDLVEFVRDAPKGLRLARDFLVPDLITRPTKDVTVGIALPVPCPPGSTEAAEEAQIGNAGVSLSVPCGDVGDPLVVIGQGLPAKADVSVRWTLPDGAFLRITENCCTTGADGSLRLETKIHPLLKTDEEPGQVTITWREVIGGPRLSPTVKTVVDLAIETLFIALLATTIGALLAIPLSFLAARNIMGRGLVGSAIYHGSRVIFNLWRAVEPMILALICAAWVAAGPFAGMLALTLWNIPNLSKLFSECIEEIDTGPVEAITATGANRMQTLIFAIAPQLVPKFLAFILYQWDINIRMSTVIGFVGGGGIGQWFREQVQLNQYAAAGLATWAIVAMVWSMDLISAKAREKLV